MVDFRIAIVISTEDQARNHVASRLSSYLRKVSRLPSDEDVTKFLSSHIEGTSKWEESNLSEEEKFVIFS